MRELVGRLNRLDQNESFSIYTHSGRGIGLPIHRHIEFEIRTLHLIFLTLIAIFASCYEGVAQSHRVSGLRVEGVNSPIGVNTLMPRFSWVMESDTRNARQTAYEIEVAQSGKSIWKSGKVYSDETLWIPYGGSALSPATKYSWRVRIWNENDEVSHWSQCADFTTALVDGDWADAKWIQLQETGRIVVPGLHLNGEAKKMLGDEKTGMYRLPQFRKVANVEKPVCQAILAVSGLGQFEMTINGQKVGHNFLDPGWTAFDKEILYVMEDVTHMIKPGDNVLGAMLGGGFYNIPRERYFKLLATYGAPRLKVRLMIDYEDGTHDDIVTDGSWRVTSSPITYSSIYGVKILMPPCFKIIGTATRTSTIACGKSQ